MNRAKVKYPLTNPLVFAIAMRDTELCQELIERILTDRKVRKIRFPKPSSSEMEKTIILSLSIEQIEKIQLEKKAAE